MQVDRRLREDATRLAIRQRQQLIHISSFYKGTNAADRPLCSQISPAFMSIMQLHTESGCMPLATRPPSSATVISANRPNPMGKFSVIHGISFCSAFDVVSACMSYLYMPRLRRDASYPGELVLLDLTYLKSFWCGYWEIPLGLRHLVARSLAPLLTSHTLLSFAEPFTN